MSGNTFLKRIDWLSIFIYLALTIIGWVSIYSSTFSESNPSILDFGTFYGKQAFFIGVSILTVVFIFATEANLFERFSGIIYACSIVLLVGLFPFGKTIAGATSWYNLGFFNLQPSEIAKVATTLALAKYLSDIQTDLKKQKDKLYAFGILIIPAILIVLQPDPGSGVVFLALTFVLFREGLPLYYLAIGLVMLLIFVATLKFGTIWVVIAVSILIALFYLTKKERVKVSPLPIILFFIASVTISLSVRFVFDSVLKQHHRDRFNLWLRLEKDPKKLEDIRKTIGYNTYQSEKAIESGGFTGKGFLQGTRTKGDFVPEQHSDYIFTTVGEEWGFLGTATVVLLFSILLLRLVYIAERQKNAFSRIYGYGVISILFIHYLINIGMVIGLVPTIGIPLPFMSYGGSGLLGFTLLLFIFLKLDANRLKEWG
ncbi:rod shape-determining protein RodA [Cellulophaga lytica]|uniref:rod shape-determining protein RodA n=1 Tax=Cellulophaga lytica TaxID=979 RepID=UPI00095080DD|nr:rod shape-determining protein RodA [Cellulophaga lytica]APU09524.1 rod shape-determining protein RodA [Cellulophaga lytica]